MQTALLSIFDCCWDILTIRVSFNDNHLAQFADTKLCNVVTLVEDFVAIKNATLDDPMNTFV